MAEIEATFEAGGPMGLKFTPVGKEVHILAINPGTQAERMPQLAPGLVLTKVGSESMESVDYNSAVTLLKGWPRPVTLAFRPAGSAAAAAAAAAPGRRSISAVFREVGTLGLKFTATTDSGGGPMVQVLAINPGTQAERMPQLQAGLVLEKVGERSVVGHSYDVVLAAIKGSGRPLELVFGADARPVAPAAMRKLRTLELRSDVVSATFTEAGSLGLKFTPVGPNVQILAVNPGTQAERLPQLVSGLVLKSVGGTSVEGMDYRNEVLPLLKAQGRPCTLTFSADGALPVSPAAEAVAAEATAKLRAGAQKAERERKREIAWAAAAALEEAESELGAAAAMATEGARELQRHEELEVAQGGLPEPAKRSAALVLELHRCGPQLTSKCRAPAHATVIRHGIYAYLTTPWTCAT